MEKKNMTYRIVHGKRKTVALQVNHNGELLVKAPLFVSRVQIESFIQQNRPWILEKQAFMAKKQEFTVRQGSRLMLLGSEYPVKYGERVEFNGSVFFVPQRPFIEIKPQLIDEYKRLANCIIKRRVEHYSQITGWQATAIKVGSAKTRWGSCSGKNTLNFTWKLVLADLDTVDYVVLHELAHTVEHNHSANFWRLVGQYMPDYKNARKRLVALQERLSVENWD